MAGWERFNGLLQGRGVPRSRLTVYHTSMDGAAPEREPVPWKLHSGYNIQKEWQTGFVKWNRFCYKRQRQTGSKRAKHWKHKERENGRNTRKRGKTWRLGQDHDITSELSSEDIQFYKNIGIKFSSVLFLSNHQCLSCVPDAAAI